MMGEMMKTIIEVSIKQTIQWEMPDLVSDLVMLAMSAHRALYKKQGTVGEALDILPVYLRKGVSKKELPKEKSGDHSKISGLQATWIIIDDPFAKSNEPPG